MIGAIVQARVSSERLPKKVILPLAGKPVLWHVLNRLKYCKRLDMIILATSTHKEDRELKNIADSLDIPTFFGSVNDVLSRYYHAAKEYKIDPIVRITADCPMIDPVVVDRIIRYYLENKDNLDHVGTAINFPDGLDTEVFSFASLEKAWQEARLPSEREHVSPYIWKNPEIFRLGRVENKENLFNMRWAVDTEKDLEFIREVFRRLYREGDIFYMEDVLDLLNKHPELMRINKGITRNEGYLKSLLEEGATEEELQEAKAFLGLLRKESP